jgi:hypothetical protein
MPFSAAGDLDELTYELEEDGVLVREQLERRVLTRGAWATVLFLYRELDRATGGYGPAKIAVVRFQKWNGGYRKHSAFPLSSEGEARELTSVVDAWRTRMSPLGGEE